MNPPVRGKLHLLVDVLVTLFVGVIVLRMCILVLTLDTWMFRLLAAWIAGVLALMLVRVWRDESARRM